MSAAFVPTFTRRLTTAGRDDAWRLGNIVINALRRGDARARRARDDLHATARHRLRRDVRRGAGQDRARDRPRADHVPLPDAGRHRGRLHGDAQLAPPLLPAGPVAGDVQRRRDPRHPRARPGAARRRHARRSSRPRWRRSWAASARSRCSGRRSRREGFRYRPVLAPRDPGLREILRADGAGHDRPRRGAGQPAGQHAAGHEPGRGARFRGWATPSG